MTESVLASGHPILQGQSIVDDLIFLMINRLVDDAASEGACLSAVAAADQVLRAYPQCGHRPSEVADLVMMIAANAGVAVVIGSRDVPSLPSAKGGANVSLFPGRTICQQ